MRTLKNSRSVRIAAVVAALLLLLVPSVLSWRQSEASQRAHSFSGASSSLGIDLVTLASLPPTATSISAATREVPVERTLDTQPPLRFPQGVVNNSIPATPTLGTMGSLSGPAAIATPLPPTDRLEIDSIDLSARVTTAGLDANNVMQTPGDPFTVAWYTFSAQPGSGGNAVFSGHVDHVTAGKSIFWNLRKVKMGDTVEYVRVDGARVTYLVTSIQTVTANQPANDLVVSNGIDMLTLITCAGGFDRRRLSYDSRLVVQATRITT